MNKPCAGLLTLLLLSVSSVALSQSSQAGGLKAEKAKLEKLDKAYKTAKTAWEKAKTNTVKRKAYVDATVKLATSVMLSPALTPKEKYPRALRLYREALKLDPKNREALSNKKMIEDIYREMGRPIPQ